MNRTASMLLGLALAACGGPKEAAPPQQADPPPPVDVAPSAATTAAPTSAETAPASTAAAAPPAPPIAIAPLTLTAEEIGTRKNKRTLELAADGTVKLKVKGQEAGTTFKFVGNELCDETGSWMTRVLADGTVEFKTLHIERRNGKLEKEETRSHRLGKFGASDELTLDQGGTVRVDDKGAIVLTGVDPNWLEPTKGLKMAFQGVTPASRRAATILFVSALTTSQSEGDFSDVPIRTPPRN